MVIFSARGRACTWKQAYESATSRRTAFPVNRASDGAKTRWRLAGQRDAARSYSQQAQFKQRNKKRRMFVIQVSTVGGGGNVCLFDDRRRQAPAARLSTRLPAGAAHPVARSGLACHLTLPSGWKGHEWRCRMLMALRRMGGRRRRKANALPFARHRPPARRFLH